MADDWRPLPRQTLRSASELAAAGLIAPERAQALEPVGQAYAIAVTPQIASLIDPADPHDPIARQFIPDLRELDPAPHELPDPIGDDAHSPTPGVVHRYPDRVLLKLLSVCPVYCRFCFRREMVGPGAEQVLPAPALERAFDYIAGTPAIWEVILTGGDPLMLSPRRLADVMARLDAIDHVKIVRIHSRVPAVDPDRIDDTLLAALKSSRKTVYVALHANHPRELNAPARAAIARLVDAGIVMVSQTVLLRGVNDDAQTLAALMRGFVENRVKPYYLHHGDLAPGTAHLRTTIEEGRALMRQLRGHLSGLAMPEYVLDIPGGHGKAPLGPDYLASTLEGAQVEDWRGLRHNYADPPRGTDS